MALVSKKLRSLEGGRLAFWCPGCNQAHWIAVGEGDGPRWGYNGNHDAPTFTPSILVRGPRMLTDEEVDRVVAGDKTLLPLPDRTCHSFITDGRIQFLGDCTHALAGQTVDLPDQPDRPEFDAA